MSFMCQHDSYLQEFVTKVESCTPATITVIENGKKAKLIGFNVILEDSILFPEGGGQPDDRGTINDVPVERITRTGDKAVNFTKTEIPAGTEVSLKVDWIRRFDHMQQHTAQHLLTATIDDLFGYSTTSWDIGTDVVSIQLDTPSMTQEQLQQAEAAANESIRKNIPVHPTFYEDKDDPELTKFRARGLPDDHVGQVRVMTIEGIDSTLCCGTHVSNLSHIQSIKIVGLEKGKKNQVNILFLAGNRLLNYVGTSFAREKTLTGILKGPAGKHCELAEKSVKALKAAQKTCNLQLREIATLEVAMFKQSTEKDTVFIKHRREGDNDYISVLLSELGDENLPKLITVGEDKEGGMFVVSGPEPVVKEAGARICELFQGKGAPGKGAFRGKATTFTTRAKADEFFRDFVANQFGAGDTRTGNES